VAVLTTLKTLTLADALYDVEAGAAFVDLRPTHDYLAVHTPESLALLYEAGPGMAAWARDCLPLDLRLLLLDVPGVDFANAAASLRGKGFNVLGEVEDPFSQWRTQGRELVTTEVIASPPAGDVILDVADPGASAPPDALRIPVESLWGELERLRGIDRIVIAAGIGVRAALAVGMLERAGVKKVQLWRSGVRSTGS
jgi:rhodanese-related sulfurtransferase